MELGRGTCILCGSQEIRPLFLISQEGAPPGHPDHNITYSHLVVVLCQANGCGQVERLDHDCFDFKDVWDQYEWYVLDPSDMKRCLKR